jgi:four helix bundle protein
MGVKTFKDIIVWQKSHKLVLRVYKITIEFPDYERYGLFSQLRRSAISISSNIVEGFKRRGKDKFTFYYYAEASLEEVKYQILLGYDLKYIKEDDYFLLIEMCDEVGRILNSWIKSSKKTT